MVTIVQYRVLGPVMAGGGKTSTALGGPRARAVLALLLVDAGRVVTDRRLIEGIWSDDTPDDAQHAIQNHVSRLRRAIEDDIAREGGGYRLAVNPMSVDSHRFEELVASARDRLADAPAAAAVLLRDALGLWQGEPFADLTDVPGLQQEGMRLGALRLSAVEDRMQADLDTGRHAEVATELEVLIREHPFRERLYAMLMLALYRAGRQAEALDVFQRARQVLSDELGVDPSPDLAELHGRILNQDPALRAGRGSDGTPTDRTATVDDDLSVVRGFELREHVGDGDFGRTYRAYHAALGREVALKVLHRDLSDLPVVVRGFERRAQRLAQLDHHRVLPLLDAWRDPGAVYVVAPWARSGSVRDTLRHGPWTSAATLRLLEQVGAALDLAHRQGVVHGDVKASNILLSGDGNARLGDFTVTPRLRDAVGLPRTNDLGVIAPEERQGAAPSMAGDVFSLAAVAIELLTGERAQVDEPVTPLRERQDLPVDLVEALALATAVGAARRPGRVADLVRHMRRALGADVVGPASASSDADRVVRNPYKGLHAFGEDDAVDFFGRSAVVDRVVQAIADHPLVAVVGPSGIGKSSIIRAGVIPTLRAGGLPGSERWLAVDMYPGSYPFDELSVALLAVAVDPPENLVAALTADDRGLARVVKQLLPGDDAQLLLVIDQFEELFSLTHDVGVRRAFLDSLAVLADDARGRVRTILTLRADFLDRPLEHHGLGDLVRAGLVSVAAPSRDDLAQAVAAPARAVGAQFEPGLVARIVGDVIDQPGGLPLLQYALTELFVRRDGLTLTQQAYDDAGGVRGALGRRAEELFVALPGGQQALARQILLRLVTVDEDVGETRRRAHRTELVGLTADRSAVDDVLQRYGAHRLLTYDHDPVTRSSTVEVAHEALLIEWGRLRRWIADRRDDLLVRRRLATETAEWLASDRGDGFLVGGGRLETLARFAETSDLAMHPDEREFVAASQARQVALARQRRRQRVVVTGAVLGVVLLAMTLIGITVVQRGRDAVREAIDHAASLATASRSAQQTDADLAVLLAQEAVRATQVVGEQPSSDALGALHEAVLGHRLVTSFDVGTFAVQFIDDDRLISPSRGEAGPAVWDLASGSRQRTLERALVQGERSDFAVSVDGRRWAEASRDGGPVNVWDVPTGDLLHQLRPVRDFLDIPAFDPTGELLAVADGAEDEPDAVRIYEVATGDITQRIGLTGSASRMAISPDGRLLAVARIDRAVVDLFDLRTREPRGHIRGPRAAETTTAVAFAPGGELIAALFQPGRLRIHDLATGDVVGDAELTSVNPFDACFSGDGSAIVVSSIGAVDVFSGATGAPLVHMADAAVASRASCGPDGARVAAGSIVDRARVWDVTPAASEVWSTAAAAPLTADWAGNAVITIQGDRRLRRYVPGVGLSATSRAGEQTDPLPLVTDGRGRFVTFWSAPDDQPDRPPDVLLFDGRTLDLRRRLATAGGPSAFDHSTSRVLVSDFSHVEIIDVGADTTIMSLDAEWSGFTPPSGAFLSDGRHAVVDDLDQTVVFDLVSGKAVATVCAAAFSSRVTASAQGGLFAVDGTRAVEVFDVDEVLDLAGGVAPGCDGENPGAGARVAFVAGTDVRFMAFSPDGSKLSTVSDDGDVSLWDPRSGRLLFTIRHDGDVGGGTFSADGRHLAVTVDDPDSEADSVRVYTLDVDELLEIADAKVTRELTPEECAGYRIADPCGGSG